MLSCKRLNGLLLPLLLVTTICDHRLVFGQSTPNGVEENSNFTFHSTASEVRLVFFAMDEHNHLVADLQKDDFAVVDDEMVIRSFRSFSRCAVLKLDVVVLIDSSESVLPHFQQEFTDVLQLLSQWPWNLGDNVSVLTFSGMEVHLICAGNCRSSFTPQAFTSQRIASLPKGGATPLYDAIEMAATLLLQRRQPDVWPVIILFSDGEDTNSVASFREASERILASEAQIYAIDTSSTARPSGGTATLQGLADESGGRYLQISEGAVKIVSDVIEDLHSARVVTYAPPKSSSGFHSIRILPTRNLTWQFRCRSGYYGDPERTLRR